MKLNPLSDVVIEPIVRNALQEDLGRAGDVTTDAIISENMKWKGALVARQSGVIAGLDLVRLAFHLTNPAVRIKVLKKDGSKVKSEDIIATITGPARAIITGERVALNFLSHLSGIASATHNLVEAVKPYKTKICCTRKTTPGLRILEKYAVRAGGGSNHRFGLDDAVLIKDNHIAVAGGVRQAVTRARENVGHMVKVELEVDTLEQLKQAIELPIDAVLLDNMDAETLKKAVAMVKGRFTTEASGRVTIDTVKQIAASGVDLISAGWITHSAPILDIGLDEG
jgi:nicotinate-nucleotide pyrophosphorylase (carboxylating)